MNYYPLYALIENATFETTVANLSGVDTGPTKASSPVYPGYEVGYLRSYEASFASDKILQKHLGYEAGSEAEAEPEIAHGPGMPPTKSYRRTENPIYFCAVDKFPDSTRILSFC
eukprot:1177320-Prorocentrum_minimum.AAC.3